MFHKEFRIKSQTAMKGSDRKKLRADVGRQFHGIDEDRLKEIIPTKDEMSVVKLETHSHDTVQVYVIQKNPMFFQVEKAIYPTVYLLWQFPDLVLIFTTWPDVFKKLEGGAALMLPGVILPPPAAAAAAAAARPHPLDALGNFPRDCCCAVRLRGNRAPVAVGKTAMSSTEMFESAMKGKGVIILHTYKDHLWELGDKSEVPTLAENIPLQMVLESRDNLTATSDPDENFALCCNDMSADDDTSDQLQSMQTLMNECDTQEEDGITGNTNEPDAAEKLLTEDAECCSSCNLPDDDGLEHLEKPYAQDSVDDLLRKCFLYALKTSAKRVELPLLTSTFFRNHMVPCCPKGSSLDVKKSTYKKLSKFLAAMQQEGFVKVEERTKGVESIVDINREHDELRSFRIPSWPLNEQDEVDKEPPSAGSNYTPPEVTDLLLVTASVLPLMRLYGKEKGSAMTLPEVKQCITDYIKTNGLQDPNNRRMVRMDVLLSDFLVKKNEYAEVLAFDDLLPRCQEKMTTAYKLSFPNQEPQIKKGHFKPITLDVAQRGSNKKVTLIDNLDLYGIDLSEFASAVQKGVACSATVEKNKDDKRVVVQGNQIRFIGQLLKENYRVPMKYIKGLEKAPKKK